MNILFYTTNEVAPQYGGVERVTANIANALTTFYNVNCYSAYKYNIDKSFIKQQFVNTIKINSYHNLNNLIQFIEQNKIDVIINQGEHKLTKSLRLALNQSQNKKCKLSKQKIQKEIFSILLNNNPFILVVKMWTKKKMLLLNPIHRYRLQIK